MLPYIILYFIVFILSFSIKKGKFKIFDFIIILVLVIFSGIRYGIGTDYFLYESIFDSVSSNIESVATNRTGICFTYLMYFIKIICNMNFSTLIFICSFITNVSMFYVIKKESSNPGLSILIYVSLGFYTLSFNMFRQMLSLSLLLVSFVFLKGKKYIRSISFFIISSFIHSISVFVFLIYFFAIRFLNNKKINPFIFILFGITAILLYNKFYSIIISNIDAFSIYSVKSYVPGIGTTLNIIVYYIIYFIFIYCNRKNLNKKNNILVNLINIGIGIMLLEFKNFLFVRIATFFTIFLIILIPKTYKDFNLSKKKFFSLTFYLSLFVYYIMYINFYGGVLPYKIISP